MSDIVELIIKISEDEYKRISNNNPSYADDFSIYYAIKNGTPLPKGQRAETKWIPVSERLPDAQKYGDKDYSDWVQITLHIGKHCDGVGRAYYCFSEKKWYMNELGVGEITAWMPLPEPYKVESEG